MSHMFPDNTRQEIKFVAYETELSTIRRWIKLHRAGFYTAFPDRQVSNVYFDTFDLAACSENLSGASARSKIRYRWYGPSIEPDAGKLEVKRKRNFFGWKFLYPVSRAPYSRGASWQEIRLDILRQLSDEGKMWLTMNPSPVILNRYVRQYYVSRDRKIRVTIDSKQSVFDQRLRSVPNFSIPTNIPRSLVVEFKFDRRDRELASEVMQRFPVRVSRHSKYMTGVLAAQRL